MHGIQNFNIRHYKKIKNDHIMNCKLPIPNKIGCPCMTVDGISKFCIKMWCLLNVYVSFFIVTKFSNVEIYVLKVVCEHNVHFAHFDFIFQIKAAKYVKINKIFCFLWMTILKFSFNQWKGSIYINDIYLRYLSYLRTYELFRN